ncbi:MAG: glutamine amidotransferase [Planctomycetaceae bacterium]
MKLSVEPIWPWPLVILACVAMVGVVCVGYPRQIRHLTHVWQRVLIALRLLLVLILTLWLLRPLIVIETENQSDAVLYVLVDSSRSMATPDGPGGMTRRESAVALFQQAQPLLADLGDSVEIRVRDLAENLVPPEQDNLSQVADGAMTAIGLNLESLARDANREKIAAILLFSDGKQAASGSKDVDAIQAARLLARQHRPIYTVPFGSSEVTATGLDVSVSELDVARDVFIRNVVPIKVRLKAFGADGRDIKLNVLVEDRSGVAAGTSGFMQAVPPGRDNVTVKLHRSQAAAEDLVVDLQFVPQQAGEIKVAVEAEPLDGEVRRTNNRVESVIRVRAGGIRVAYFDRLRPEFKWLKRINVSSRIQLDAKWLKSGEFSEQNRFDETWFEPGNYDAFIIGDVPAEAFGDERLRKLYVCCEQGAGLMMTGGVHSFGAGGYQRTPLAELLPVSMSDTDQQLTGDVKMIPKRAAHSILQIASPDQNSACWNDLPPLVGASVLKEKSGSAAEVLAESNTRMPLLIGQSTGRARVLAFAGDTTWQWAMHADWGEEVHQRFWRQVIFWLTKMEYDGESPLWVAVEPRDLNPGRPAELSFGVRDENGLPLNGVSYTVKVQRPDGENEDVTARAIDAHAEADYQNTSDPGDYWVHVSAEGKPGQGQLFANTRFLVNARDPELDNPAADPGLMRELAHVSGGDFLTPDSMLERLRKWSDQGLPSLQLKHSERINLWDNWISLALFVIVLALEWFFRKKRGLV